MSIETVEAKMDAAKAQDEATRALKPAKRVWKPTDHDAHIAEWTWTKAGGLRVRYNDGLEAPSDWGSLREFLKAIREKREFAREVKPVARPSAAEREEDAKARHEDRVMEEWKFEKAGRR